MHRPTLPTAEQRAEARRVYGTDPEGYESGRPDYPDRVLDVLTSRCGMRAGAAVLEIGPGTGRVTKRLIALGAHVTAVEPDPSLAAYLRAMLPEATIVEGTFESAPLANDHYDLAIAAMSFHWVDQEAGLPKLRRVLHPGGWVALWWTLFGDPSRRDRFREATRDLLAPQPAKAAAVVPFEIDVGGWRHALLTTAGLTEFDAEVIRWIARFDSLRLRAFYASTIAVRRRTQPEQERLLDELVSRAQSGFGSVVERPFVTALYTARRSERSN